MSSFSLSALLVPDTQALELGCCREHHKLLRSLLAILVCWFYKVQVRL